MDDFSLPTQEQFDKMAEEYKELLPPKAPEFRRLAELCEEQTSLLMALVLKCKNKLLLDILEQLVSLKEKAALEFRKMGNCAQAEIVKVNLKSASARFLFRETLRLQNEVIVEIMKEELWATDARELIFLEVLRFVHEY